MARSETLRAIVLAVITFGVMIGIEQIFYLRNKQWFESGDQHVSQAPDIQNKSARWLLRYIVLWGFGDYINLLTILVYSATLQQRHKAFLHVVFYCAMISVSWILQASYAQPLFFTMFPLVYQPPAEQTDWPILSCNFKFGLPSTHAVENMALFVYIVIDYYKQLQEDDKKRLSTSRFSNDASIGLNFQISEKQPYFTWKSILMMTLAITFLATNGYMRVFCDLNTYNQVLFGWAVGIWLACVFAFFVRQPIYTHIKALVADENDLDWYGKMPLFTIITVVVLVSIPVLCIILQHENSSIFLKKAADNFTNDTTKIYYSNYSQTCQHLVKDSTKIKYEVNQYYSGIIQQSGKLVLIFSCYAGLIYQKYKFQGQTGFTTFEYDTKCGQNLKHLGRLIVYFFLFLVCEGIGQIIVLSVRNEKPSPGQTSVVYFFKYFLPYLVGGFIWFAFGDTICFKLGLYKKFLSYRTSEDSFVERRTSEWGHEYVYNPNTQSVERLKPLNENNAKNKQLDYTFNQHNTSSDSIHSIQKNDSTNW